jgi:hypothetical protein
MFKRFVDIAFLIGIFLVLLLAAHALTDMLKSFL